MSVFGRWLKINFLFLKFFLLFHVRSDMILNRLKINFWLLTHVPKWPLRPIGFFLKKFQNHFLSLTHQSITFSHSSHFLNHFFSHTHLLNNNKISNHPKLPNSKTTFKIYNQTNQIFFKTTLTKTNQTSPLCLIHFVDTVYDLNL